MDQSELAEQLALVQEMVQEMKTGFATAMEELANIQFGDQNLQQQMADDRTENRQMTIELTEAVQALKAEVQNLSGQLHNVSETQRALEEKVDSIQSFDKQVLLEELQNIGVLNDQARYQLQVDKRPSDVQSKEVSPLVHPYLASLTQDKAEDSDAQSVTALACKSLNLSQALHEKCLHLDLSASSDDDDTVRHAQPAGMGLLNTESSHLPDAKAHFSSKKVPPHEKLLEEVQREKSAQESTSAERSYCSQLWTLIDAIIRPLRQEELMTQRDLNSVFPSYLPHLYEQHCIMLQKMEERMLKWKYTGLMGDIFLKFTDAQEGEGLSVYKDYINDFPTVISNLNYWFSQSVRFRDVMGSSNLASSSVVPLLLAPLQQIPKYSLLIKNLLKYTGTDHPDRYYLETALSRLKNFLGIMNSNLEHAMQFMNVNKSPIARSRDYGNSTRSRSSGSSCDANQVSSARDSGIHSNGEDNLLRQPASPNTTRRYVLQVLRDRREREAAESMHEVRERPMSAIPIRTHAHGYGSHPDLSTHQLSEFVAGGPRDLPSYAPYQSGSKMYSSMTKIQQPRDPPKSPEKPPRKIKIRRRPDSQKTNMNTNYMRPLTPHFPFNSAPRQDTYKESEPSRPHSSGRRLRNNRPSSSIDFMSSDSERRNKMMEQMSFNPSALSTPREHSSDGRSRSELHLSLQRMMAERDRSDALEKDRYGGRSGDLFQTLDISSVHSSERESRDSYLSHKNGNFGQDMQQQEEDYGIFGDDDEEDNSSYQQSPREFTSQRPSHETEHTVGEINHVSLDRYSQSKDIGSRAMSGEQLAASLALSLRDPNRRQISTEEEDSMSSHDPADQIIHGRQGSVNISPGQQITPTRVVTGTFESFSNKESNAQVMGNVQSPNEATKQEPKKPARGVNSLKCTPVLRNNTVDYPAVEGESNSGKQDIQNHTDDPRLVHPSGQNTESMGMMNTSTLERARKYVVPAEKPSEDDIPIKPQAEKVRTSFSDINRNDLKVSSVDSNNVVKRTSLPIAQQQNQRSSIGTNSVNMSADVSNIPSPRGRTGSASVERTPKKLPVLQGRLSQPNLEQVTGGAKFPSPPVSPTNMTAKDTKIPLYTPNRSKKDRAPTTPRDPMSKSTEDVSKLKKKTVKQSIKNFFGRKRRKAKYEFQDSDSLTNLHTCIDGDIEIEVIRDADEDDDEYSQEAIQIATECFPPLASYDPSCSYDYEESVSSTV